MTGGPQEPDNGIEPLPLDPEPACSGRSLPTDPATVIRFETQGGSKATSPRDVSKV
jgi:hypothetical protein